MVPNAHNRNRRSIGERVQTTKYIVKIDDDVGLVTLDVVMNGFEAFDVERNPKKMMRNCFGKTNPPFSHNQVWAVKRVNVSGKRIIKESRQLPPFADSNQPSHHFVTVGLQ